jgi:KUP system potassium uptake protein
MASQSGGKSAGWRDLTGRMLGSVGIVYGDIGTSVLYAVHESFFGTYRLESTPENVLGVMSFFFWSLVLVIGCKYVLLIMRADNHGEGGIFALLALLKGVRGRLGARRLTFIWGLIVLGAALLLADGMITPAITILSAVEGLGTLAPHLKDWVVPVTLVILVALFALQVHGTHRIGRIFGPTMVLWFIVIAVLGLPHIYAYPQVLWAVNPVHAVRFVLVHRIFTLVTLGAVVLCITGGEALYADLGHFSRRPITLSWWYLVLPCLLINYFGQGALLLSGTATADHRLFYALAPAWALVPLIVLATAATIIASQALISGSFSLIQQAIALGVFPRQRIVHTNAEIEGQIYLPAVNWALMVGCLGLVLGFRTSSGLAAAYGIAVTGTMAITTAGFYLVAIYVFHWRRLYILPVCAFFLAVDLTFFGSNLLKFIEGGFVPVLIAWFLFAVMHCWYWGRQYIAQCYQRLAIATVRDLLEAKKRPGTALLDRSLVVLASRPVSALSDTIPPALQSRLDHLGAIYKHVTILSVIQHPGVREIERQSRFLINKLQDDPQLGTLVTVQVFYGYMQDPDLSQLLHELQEKGVIHAGNDPSGSPFTILSGAERLIPGHLSLLDRLRMGLFRILLRNANTVLKYFNLENYRDVSTEVVTLSRDATATKSWLRKI